MIENRPEVLAECISPFVPAKTAGPTIQFNVPTGMGVTNWDLDQGMMMVLLPDLDVEPLMDKIAEIERCLTEDDLSVGETATKLALTFQLVAKVFMWHIQGGDRPAACKACVGTGANSGPWPPARCPVCRGSGVGE